MECVNYEEGKENLVVSFKTDSAIAILELIGEK